MHGPASVRRLSEEVGSCQLHQRTVVLTHSFGAVAKAELDELSLPAFEADFGEILSDLSEDQYLPRASELLSEVSALAGVSKLRLFL